MLLAEENLTPKKGLSPGHVVVSEESQSRADTEATREEFRMSCLSCCGVVFFSIQAWAFGLGTPTAPEA